MDLVSELLSGMRLRGASYSKLRLAPPFGIGFAPTDDAHFHFVATGTLRLRPADGEMTGLSCGDAVLLPRGDAHALVSAPGARVRPFDSYETVPLCSNICMIDDLAQKACENGETLIFSGRMQFELDTLHPLVSLMPQVLSVRALTGRQPELHPLLAAMEREMAAERAGAAGILARLADVVAASIVRGWVEGGCGDATGWVEALRDPRLGRVIAALHRKPGHDWTIEEMAAEMGSSRSVFAERFVAVTGTTPSRYLLALRMRLAARWIGNDGLSIDGAARRLGYGSRAAFSRAYKRATGTSPGQLRRAGDPALEEERSAVPS
ncbi:AraC-like DNA-binding protein [Pseudochelatococcus lubricantis]|uniref:AraC-like DNA-binding protein n=1 Tax=Pseudochelatococcus lubricantis TaxID=1538102 RepID=A0ABX0V0J7_9HYPH|nr:AraC family transcriptional regulator [Pseudochelatococcus lubricantis]NIJ58696.1 AraC-like DNA-binding protein [Pseudochelatococcus lubricantis]